MKKISIIVPMYNAEKNLKQCLDSIINQSYKELEIILINDGSEDSTKKICEEYLKKDNRIILVNQKNSGPAQARNYGLEIATGDYISFVDSDDYLNLEFYEKLLNRILSDKSDIALCKHVEVINDEILHMNYGCSNEIIKNDEILKLFLKGNTINAYLWNKLYKKELFENVDFCDLKMLEDLDIMYRILCKCKRISFSNNEMYYYRCDNSNSLSKICSKQMIDDFYNALNKMYGDLKFNKHIINEIYLNKVIMYIPFFSSISHSPYYRNDEKFKNAYLDYQSAFKYIKKSKYYTELNIKQKIKGLLLFYNKTLFYKLYRKKMN